MYKLALCSASCGIGVSMRRYSCPPPDEENYFTCGSAPPEQKRSCRGPFNRYNHSLCRGRKKRQCLADKSKFCSLPTLETYCNLAGFRRICCKTCSEIMLTPVAW